MTLALFLGLQGITLKLIGEGGTVPIRDDGHLRAGQQATCRSGWAGSSRSSCVVGYAALKLLRWQRQRTPGTCRASRSRWCVVQIVVVAVALLGGAYVLNRNRAPNPLVRARRACPWGVPLVAVLLIFCTFVLGRTRYGRHVYAVGGNAEAARRAGINVDPDPHVRCS